MRVRPCKLEDRDFIIGLSARFAESRLPPWRPADMIVGRRRGNSKPHSFRAARARTSWWPEDDDGAPLGFAWVLLLEDFFTRGDYGKNTEIATPRAGTGAGAALMNACEAWARERGCVLVMLNVLRENDHARAFYEGHGYEPEYTAMTKVISEAGA